jgi:hypothetical protein
LRRFLAEPITPEQAWRAILTRLARREETFLGLLESAVFGYARSPYRKLFPAAGCELGDVCALVAREGLEPTLVRLRDAGVFVSFEEYKGATPAVRGSQTFHFLENDFDNPLLRPAYLASTGGSRGTAPRISPGLREAVLPGRRQHPPDLRKVRPPLHALVRHRAGRVAPLPARDLVPERAGGPSRTPAAGGVRGPRRSDAGR